jgi:hypothetical protein
MTNPSPALASLGHPLPMGEGRKQPHFLSLWERERKQVLTSLSLWQRERGKFDGGTISFSSLSLWERVASVSDSEREPGEGLWTLEMTNPSPAALASLGHPLPMGEGRKQPHFLSLWERERKQVLTCLSLWQRKRKQI